MKFVVPLKKAQPVETEEGLLTDKGMAVAHDYAKQWVDSTVRDLSLEREYPELAGLFWDIRTDPGLAREHAIPSEE